MKSQCDKLKLERSENFHAFIHSVTLKESILKFSGDVKKTANPNLGYVRHHLKIFSSPCLDSLILVKACEIVEECKEEDEYVNILESVKPT